MKLFWKAIYDNLITQGTLVSECGFTSSPFKPTISRADFQTAGYDRGVYFEEAPGPPYIFNSDTVELKDWVVDFHIIGPTEVIMADIAKAFEDLFNQTPNAFSYWNFSNDDIYVQSTSIIDIVGGKHNDERNVWHCVYSVMVRWSYC